MHALILIKKLFISLDELLIHVYVFNFVGTASLHKMDVNQREDAASPARGVRASVHKEPAVCGYQHRDHTAEYGDMEGRHRICH